MLPSLITLTLEYFFVICIELVHVKAVLKRLIKNQVFKMSVGISYNYVV